MLDDDQVMIKIITRMTSIIVASLASPILIRDDDDQDDNGTRGRDDRYQPRHDNYHRNTLCISTCSLITIIITAFAWSRMCNVRRSDDDKDDDREDNYNRSILGITSGFDEGKDNDDGDDNNHRSVLCVPNRR